MPPGAVIVTFPAHVMPAILCLVLALVVLAFLAVLTAGKRRR